MSELQEIRARHEAATKGPYQWAGYRDHGNISLVTKARGLMGSIVMEFWRWTKTETDAPPQHGIPVFNVDGILERADRFLTVHEYHRGGEILGIDHPDAIALEKSWEDVDALLKVVNAAVCVKEPSVLTKQGQFICALCHREVILSGHSDTCEWKRLQDILDPLMQQAKAEATESHG